jgi:hypothetical protein
MRSALLLTLSLLSASLCSAQAPAPAPNASQSNPSTAPDGVIEKRTERIQIEDGGARIDELRIGGETKSITVKPKGGMPAYDVQPASGERSWKILGF